MTRVSENQLTSTIMYSNGTFAVIEALSKAVALRKNEDIKLYGLKTYYTTALVEHQSQTIGQCNYKRFFPS